MAPCGFWGAKPSYCSASKTPPPIETARGGGCLSCSAATVTAEPVDRHQLCGWTNEWRRRRPAGSHTASGVTTPKQSVPVLPKCFQRLFHFQFFITQPLDRIQAPQESFAFTPFHIVVTLQRLMCYFECCAITTLSTSSTCAMVKLFLFPDI